MRRTFALALLAVLIAGCATLLPQLTAPGAPHTLKIRLWNGADLRSEALRLRHDRERQSRNLGAAIRAAARAGRIRPYHERQNECSPFTVRFEHADFKAARGRMVAVNGAPEPLPPHFGPETEIKVPVCGGEGRLRITTEWLLANVAVKIKPPDDLRIIYPTDGRALGTCTVEEIRRGYRRCPLYEERYRNQSEFFSIVRFEEAWDRMSNYHFAADREP